MTSLSDRMKLYESIETGRMFVPKLPIIARLDGRSFHTFTSGLARPYDERLSRLMIAVTERLVRDSCARIGYTQSDEISLIFYSSDIESQVFFAGKPYKMISILAAMATAEFNKLLPEFIPEKAQVTALFDCRVWTVPTRAEAVNVLVWREQDATRNSISMAAQEFYSQNELYKKSTDDMQEMIYQKGVNWNDYPSFFKRGAYIQRKKVMRKFSLNELDGLPPKHNAVKNPNLEFERSDVSVTKCPPILRVQNRAHFVFDSQSPARDDLSWPSPVDRG